MNPDAKQEEPDLVDPETEPDDASESEDAPDAAEFTKTIGTKDEVWNGEAQKTSGGLTKADLCISKRGKVVSAAMSRAASLRFAQNAGAMAAAKRAKKAAREAAGETKPARIPRKKRMPKPTVEIPKHLAGIAAKHSVQLRPSGAAHMTWDVYKDGSRVGSIGQKSDPPPVDWSEIFAV